MGHTGDGSLGMGHIGDGSLRMRHRGWEPGNEAQEMGAWE